MSLLYNIERSQVRHYHSELLKSRESNHAIFFGPEYLLRLLLILPRFLDSNSNGRSQPEVKQTLLYAQDIIEFMCENCTTIFEKKYASLFELYPGPTPLHECDEDSLSFTSNSAIETQASAGTSFNDKNNQDE